MRRWLRRVGLDRVQDLYALNEADVRGKGKDDIGPELAALASLKVHVERVLAQGAALSTKDLEVDGHDLMRDLGLKPGRVLGELLTALLEEVIADPEKNRRDVLLTRAREMAGERDKGT